MEKAEASSSYIAVYGLDRATACEQIKNYLGKGIQAPEYESFKKTVKSKPEVIHADRAPDRVLHQNIFHVPLHAYFIGDTRKKIFWNAD